MATVSSNGFNPRTFILYFHLVFLRSAGKSDKMEQMYSHTQALLSSGEVAQWYLAQINETFLNEFLFLAENDIRCIVTGLVCQAIQHCPSMETGRGVL